VTDGVWWDVICDEVDRPKDRHVLNSLVPELGEIGKHSHRHLAELAVPVHVTQDLMANGAGPHHEIGFTEAVSLNEG
jgi:hypothetical protein